MTVHEPESIGRMSKAVRAELRAELNRIGLTVLAIFRDDEALPPGLSVAVINRWMSGLIDKASERHVAYVRSKLASMPDDAGRIAPDGTAIPRPGKRGARGDQTRIPVTSEMSAFIRAELVRTRSDAASIMRDAIDPPERLNARIIKGWLYQDAATTEAAHWNYVVTLLADRKA